MNETENALYARAQPLGIAAPTWEAGRAWLNAREWKINVLSDYPRGEVKFTVRRGFERIEIMGLSDLEVMLKAVLEIHRRDQIERSPTVASE